MGTAPALRGRLIRLQRERIVQHEAQAAQQEQGGDDLVRDPERVHRPAVHPVVLPQDEPLVAMEVLGCRGTWLVYY